MVFSDDEIQSETNNGLKLAKTVLNLQKLINHITDKELKLKSVVVPVQKRTTHNEMIGVFEKYRFLHEELLESGKTGVLIQVQEKQKEIKKYKKTMDEFVKKFLLDES